METEHVTWIRISRAAQVLEVSEDTVRRMVSAGQLAATADPDALAAAATGRGRPPALLVSLESVIEARAEQNHRGAEGRSRGQAEVMARVPALELELELVRIRTELEQLRETATLELVRDELSRLRADLSNIRHVALQSLERDEALERAERARLESDRSRIDAELARLDADRARREQLRVFLVPDLAPDH